jgi:hypothetical protein
MPSASSLSSKRLLKSHGAQRGDEGGVGGEERQHRVLGVQLVVGGGARVCTGMVSSA